MTEDCGAVYEKVNSIDRSLKTAALPQVTRVDSGFSRSFGLLHAKEVTAVQESIPSLSDVKGPGVENVDEPLKLDEMREETFDMRIAFRASLAVILTLCCVCAWASEEDPQKITITGTLSRSMTIGAESSGWIVQVDSEAVIDGKPISSIEVAFSHNPKKLEEFDNKRVKIAGKVAYRHGVETGTQTYVEIASIKALK